MLDVKVEQLLAAVFNPTLIDKPRPTGLRMRVGFRDGSWLAAVDLAADQHVASAKLAGGAELKSATEAIVALQSFDGRACIFPISNRSAIGTFPSCS